VAQELLRQVADEVVAAKRWHEVAALDQSKVARETEPCLLGSYTTAFLHAQAVSTWQAMLEAGRPCFLLVIAGSLADAGAPLADFFAGVERAVAAGG
jgi:hypothetical protein